MKSESGLSIIPIAVFTMTVAACGGSGSSTSATQYRIVANQGSSLSAIEGDALSLSVVQVNPDDSTAPLPSGATVTWSGPPTITALPEGSTPADSILPQPGATTTSMWLKNPEHLTDAQLNGVLYVLDKGTAPNPSISIKATIGGSAPAGEVTATLPVAAFPAGSMTAGQALYADNCSSCHGAQGQGTTLGPGLNNSMDDSGDPNVAADSAWTGALFAISPRSNIDNDGVSLAASMPRWLITEARSGQFLTTQNLADIYAFLKTQTTP
jgi:mono/diheme cytochrome c family protein